MNDIKRPIGLFLMVIVFVFALFAIAQLGDFNRPTPRLAQATAYDPMHPVPPHAPTEKDMIAAQPAKGFQTLVSYTDRGFEPENARIKKGDTVRFTNNSTEDMWVAAHGSDTSIYPGVANGCGSSALDTCRALKPGEYWEFTFTTSGTWGVTNNVDKSRTGVIQVQ